MKPIYNIVAFALIFCAAKFSTISAQSMAINENSQKLSSLDSNKVNSIISHYDKNLTSDDAHAIISSFRSAGLQKGPALEMVIKQAGFDPELLYRLASAQNTLLF